MNQFREQDQKEAGNSRNGGNFQEYQQPPNVAPGMPLAGTYRAQAYPVFYVPMMFMPFGMSFEMVADQSRLFQPHMQGIRTGSGYYFPGVPAGMNGTCQFSHPSFQPINQHQVPPGSLNRTLNTSNSNAPGPDKLIVSSANPGPAQQEVSKAFEQEFASESEELVVENSLFGFSDAHQECDPQTDPEKINDPLAKMEEKFAKLVR